jgi:AcrR family transcriptional regulator
MKKQPVTSEQLHDKKKSDITRARIIAAAKEVFSRLPYQAASMRMIGKEGMFNHELIRYHFPNKAKLFETIMCDICDDFYRSNISFLDGLEKMDPAEGFPLYLDRFLDNHYRNPEALRIIVLNMVMTDEPERIPGYRYIPEMLASTRRTFQEKIPLHVSDEKVERFLSGINNLLLHLLGASYCQASILGLKHTGNKYREWVKTTMVEIFLPHLEQLIRASK